MSKDDDLVSLLEVAADALGGTEEAYAADGKYNGPLPSHVMNARNNLASDSIRTSMSSIASTMLGIEQHLTTIANKKPETGVSDQPLNVLERATLGALQHEVVRLEVREKTLVSALTSANTRAVKMQQWAKKMQDANIMSWSKKDIEELQGILTEDYA